jgi:hypothetical protein
LLLENDAAGVAEGLEVLLVDVVVVAVVLLLSDVVLDDVALVALVLLDDRILV